MLRVLILSHRDDETRAALAVVNETDAPGIIAAWEAADTQNLYRVHNVIPDGPQDIRALIEAETATVDHDPRD